MKKQTVVIRTDELASPDILGKHLPALELAGLCNYHLREINLREHVRKNPHCEHILKDFRFILQEARVSTHTWEHENFKLFCTKWPGAAADFARSHFPHRQRWALAYAPVFLAGRTGNTTAEQGMHSVSSWFSENKA